MNSGGGIEERPAPVAYAPGWTEGTRPFCTECVNGVRVSCVPCHQRLKLVGKRLEERWRPGNPRRMAQPDLHEAWRVGPPYSAWDSESGVWRDTPEFKAATRKLEGERQ